MKIGEPRPGVTAYFVDGSSSKLGITDILIRVEQWATPQSIEFSKTRYDEKRITIAALCDKAGISAEELALLPLSAKRAAAFKTVEIKSYLGGKLVDQTPQQQSKKAWAQVRAITDATADIFSVTIDDWSLVPEGTYGGAIREVACNESRRATLRSESMPASSDSYDCSRSGQYYQDRAKLGGRVEDMVCMQRAMQRELKAN